MRAIFEIDGDRLRISYNLAGQDYPTNFSTPAGPMLLMVRHEHSE
jgi:hypothetical protein